MKEHVLVNQQFENLAADWIDEDGRIDAGCEENREHFGLSGKSLEQIRQVFTILHML